MFNIAHKVQTIFHASLFWGVNIKLAMFQSNAIVPPRYKVFSWKGIIKHQKNHLVFSKVEVSNQPSTDANKSINLGKSNL